MLEKNYLSRHGWPTSLQLLLISFAAASRVREGADYALQAYDGRWLVASADAGVPLLHPELSSGLTARTFTFVRVPSTPDTVYLKFGDVVLTATAADGDRSDDPAKAAQFRLLTRPLDGKVALYTSWGTWLRPGAPVGFNGAAYLEQGLARPTRLYGGSCALSAATARLRMRRPARASKRACRSVGSPPVTVPHAVVAHAPALRALAARTLALS